MSTFFRIIFNLFRPNVQIHRAQAGLQAKRPLFRDHVFDEMNQYLWLLRNSKSKEPIKRNDDNYLLLETLQPKLKT